MKKYRLVGITLLVLLSITVAWWIISNKTPDVVEQKLLAIGPSQGVGNQGLAVGVSSMLNPIADSKDSSDDGVMAKLAEIAKISPKAAIKASLMVHPGSDIVFHGKIIDQHGKPVQGVTVGFSAASPFGGGAINYQTISGVNGEVVIKDIKGGSLSIKSMSKNGYQFHIKDEEGHSTFRAFKDGARKLVWSEHTKDNPYIYHAWEGESVELVGSDYSVVPFVPDGRTYTLYLDKRRTAKKEGKFEGDLWVTFDRPMVSSKRDAVDWSLTLAVPSGGLIKTDEQLMNKAPEFGYEPQVVIRQTASEHSWKKSLDDQRFYIKSRDGDYYGKLVLDVRPIFGKRKESAIVFNYWMNTSGSRNLMNAKADVQR